tara:strand:+ start:210 stop:362 length:153 start_codon:yes stop_codon:yes gene_type:complete
MTQNQRRKEFRCDEILPNKDGIINHHLSSNIKYEDIYYTPVKKNPGLSRE